MHVRDPCEFPAVEESFQGRTDFESEKLDDRFDNRSRRNYDFVIDLEKCLFEGFFLVNERFERADKNPYIEIAYYVSSEPIGIVVILVSKRYFLTIIILIIMVKFSRSVVCCS